MATEPKKVNLVCISAYKHDGQHIAVGEVVYDVESELAKELTGAGRTRLAKDDDIAAAKKKSAKKVDQVAA